LQNLLVAGEDDETAAVDGGVDACEEMEAETRRVKDLVIEGDLPEAQRRVATCDNIPDSEQTTDRERERERRENALFLLIFLFGPTNRDRERKAQGRAQRQEGRQERDERAGGRVQKEEEDNVVLLAFDARGRLAGQGQRRGRGTGQTRDSRNSNKEQQQRFHGHVINGRGLILLDGDDNNDIDDTNVDGRRRSRGRDWMCDGCIRDQETRAVLCVARCSTLPEIARHPA